VVTVSQGSFFSEENLATHGLRLPMVANGWWARPTSGGGERLLQRARRAREMVVRTRTRKSRIGLAYLDLSSRPGRGAQTERRLDKSHLAANASDTYEMAKVALFQLVFVTTRITTLTAIRLERNTATFVARLLARCAFNFA